MKSLEISQAIFNPATHFVRLCPTMSVWIKNNIQRDDRNRQGPDFVSVSTHLRPNFGLGWGRERTQRDSALSIHAFPCPRVGRTFIYLAAQTDENRSSFGSMRCGVPSTPQVLSALGIVRHSLDTPGRDAPSTCSSPETQKHRALNSFLFLGRRPRSALAMARTVGSLSDSCPGTLRFG